MKGTGWALRSGEHRPVSRTLHPSSKIISTLHYFPYPTKMISQYNTDHMAVGYNKGARRASVKTQSFLRRRARRRYMSLLRFSGHRAWRSQYVYHFCARCQTLMDDISISKMIQGEGAHGGCICPPHTVEFQSSWQLPMRVFVVDHLSFRDMATQSLMSWGKSDTHIGSATLDSICAV